MIYFAQDLHTFRSRFKATFAKVYVLLEGYYESQSVGKGRFFAAVAKVPRAPKG